MTDGDLNDGYGSEVAIFDVKIIINEGWMPGEYKEEGDGYNWGKTEYPGPGPYQEYTMCAISDFVYSVYACSQSLAAYRFNEMVPEPGN